MNTYFNHKDIIIIIKYFRLYILTLYNLSNVEKIIINFLIP